MQRLWVGDHAVDHAQRQRVNAGIDVGRFERVQKRRGEHIVERVEIFRAVHGEHAHVVAVVNEQYVGNAGSLGCGRLSGAQARFGGAAHPHLELALGQRLLPGHAVGRQGLAGVAEFSITSGPFEERIAACAANGCGTVKRMSM